MFWDRMSLLALSQALCALVKHAPEASISCSVNVSVTVSVDNIISDIEGQGCGMDKEALTHAGKPFRTIKEIDKGMRPGIFFARSTRSTVDKLGGKMRIASVSGKSPKMTVSLSRNGLLS